ncbi:MAG: peptidoglycan recognition family protein, partial [Candidatus Dojkabacteria bacterium]|nr:peptidoglycan recognition family protein [Candidatus Dojkabacteria bacterium]
MASVLTIVVVLITGFLISKDYNSRTIGKQPLNSDDGVEERAGRGEDNDCKTIRHTEEDNNSNAIISTIVPPEGPMYDQIEIRDLVIQSATKQYSPAGSITDLKIGKIARDSFGRLDLTDYSRETFSISWQGDVFNFSLSENGELSELATISLSDEIDPDSDLLISDLLAFEDAKYLFINPKEELVDLEIHLYDPYDIEKGKTTANDASGYNSGASYTTLPIIKREEWSDDVSINDPRTYEECDFPIVGYENPAWCIPATNLSTHMRWYPRYYDVEKVVIHHTATPNDTHSGEYWVRSIYNYHAYSYEPLWCADYIDEVCVQWRKGWGDIGYNYLIDKDGNIYEGKLGGDEAKGYHAGDGNANSIGVAVIGTYSDELPTSASRYSLRRLIAEKAAFYNFVPQWETTVFAHRYWGGTTCPGQAFY